MTDADLLAALEVKHVKLSQAKDGDLFVLRSNDVDWDVIWTVRKGLERLTGKNIAVIGMGPDDDFQLMEGSKARAILEQLAKKP